jgi:hypothetical protein
MKSFKQFLSEANTVSNLDVRKFGLDELIACYENAGYEVPKNERRFFIDSKYMGYTKNHQHKFAVMMENDNDPEDFTHYISDFYVELGKEGSLIAEPGGTPSFHGDEDEVQDHFDKLTAQ